MSLIAEHVSRLSTVLEAEEDLYLRMRGLLLREEQELITLEPIELDRTIAEKRALAEEGRLLEESRVLLTRALAQAIGLPAEGCKLSDLIAQLADEAGGLPEIHGRLSALVAANRALLDANERFANRSLDRVRETLSMLGQAVPEQSGYGPGTARAAQAGRGRLVRQAI